MPWKVKASNWENVFMFAPSNVEISKDARTLMMRNKFTKPFGGGEQ